MARTLLTARRSPSPAAVELTDREREVLALVGLGLANKQIARRLDIREGTVKAHLDQRLPAHRRPGPHVGRPLGAREPAATAR